jgi:hypothetical protein
MMKFDEAERPSFIELAKLVLTSEENTLHSPNEENKVARSSEERKIAQNEPVSSSLNNMNPWESAEIQSSHHTPHVNSTQDSLPLDQRGDSGDGFRTQSELFKNYVEANSLYINYGSHMLWFQAGGNQIGKKPLTVEVEGEEPVKWKLHARFSQEFHSHVMIVPTDVDNAFFVLGGTKSNCFYYKDGKMVAKKDMPEKSFFSAVYLKGKIYSFGGFDIFDKIQLKTCEEYDVEKDEWKAFDRVRDS